MTAHTVGANDVSEIDMKVPITLPFIWDNGYLVITDDEALKTLDRGYLSPSSSDAILSCPARWASDKLMPRAEDPFSPADIGSGGHEVLEALYLLPSEQRTQEQTKLILDRVTAENKSLFNTPLHPDAVNEWRDVVWLKIEQIFDIETPQKIQVRQCEWPLRGIEIAGVPFMGIIDRTDIVRVDDDFGTAIVDYKTGKFKSAYLPWGDLHGDQLRLYAEAVRVWDNKSPVEARLIYTGAGKQRFVSLAQRDMKKTLARFAQAWEILQQSIRRGAFSSETSPLCSWCPLVTTCPKAIEEGYEPHDPSMQTVSVEVVAKPTLNDEGEQIVLGEPDNQLDNNTDTGYTGPSSEDAPEAQDESFRTNKPKGTKRAKSRKTENMNQEDKVWIETVNNGDLNLNSFAARGVFGLVSFSLETLTKHDEKVTKASVKAIVSTFAGLVLDTQEWLTGNRGWQDGANTRVRGALISTINSNPPPFGKDYAAWVKWQTAVERRMRAVSAAAKNVWEEEPDAEAWQGVFATDSEADGTGDESYFDD